MFKLKDKKIVAIVRKIVLLNWPYVMAIVFVTMDELIHELYNSSIRSLIHELYNSSIRSPESVCQYIQIHNLEENG